MSCMKVADQWESLPSFSNKFVDVSVHHLYLFIHLCQWSELDKSDFLSAEMKTVVQWLAQGQVGSKPKTWVFRFYFFFFRNKQYLLVHQFYFLVYTFVR